MSVVVQLVLPDGLSYFLCQVGEALHEAMINDIEVLHNVTRNLVDFDFVPTAVETPPTELRSKILICVDNEGNMSASSAPLIGDVLGDTVTLDSSTDTPTQNQTELALADLNRSLNESLVLDDIKSPPKKKPHLQAAPTTGRQLFPSPAQESEPSHLDPERKRSRKLIVQGVVADFIPEHLLRFLNKQASETFEIVAKGVKIATECEIRAGSDPTDRLIDVIVTFTTDDFAQQFFELSSLFLSMYEDETLLFVPIYEEDVPKTNTRFVQFENLAPDFIEAHFIRFLARLPGNCDTDVHLAQREPTVVVEFSSCSVAEATASKIGKGKTKYDGCIISAELIFFDKNTLTPGPKDTCEPSSSRTKSDYEKQLLFVKALVRLRKMFDSRNHDAAFVTLHSELCAIGVDWDIATLRSRRRSLLGSYNNKKKSGSLDKWEFSAPFAVITGSADVSTLDNTDFAVTPSTESDTSFASDLEKFCKGAVWTHKATLALIAVVKENRSKWEDDRTTNLAFYKEVSEVLKASYKYFYEPSSCEKKISSLKREYRDEVKRMGKTGEPSASQFPFYEQMEDFMGEDHTVRPKRVLAVGAAGQLTETSTPVTTRGVTRPAALKRPQSIKERKTAALEAIAQIVVKKYSPS